MPRSVRAVIRSEAGNYMIGTMIGSLVMFLVTGAVAVGIAGIFLFQQAITDRTDLVKEATLADSSLRSDILWASAIAPVDDRSVELTVPGQGGGCHISTWTIDTAAGETSVSSTVVNYSGYDAAATPVRCAGTPSSPIRQTIITDASPSSAFTYSNTGGRPLGYTAGAPAPGGPATAPTGIDQRVWGSTILGAVTLETRVSTPSGRTAPHRTTQTADNLNIVPRPADAASNFVPEGTLTIP